MTELALVTEPELSLDEPLESESLLLESALLELVDASLLLVLPPLQVSSLVVSPS